MKEAEREHSIFPFCGKTTMGSTCLLVLLQLAVHRQWKFIWLMGLGSSTEHPAKAFLLCHSMEEAEARGRVSKEGLLLEQALPSLGNSHAYHNINSLTTESYKPHLMKVPFPSNTVVANEI